MRRSLLFAFAITLFAFAITLFATASAQAQVGMPGIEYSNTIAGGDGVQLYPYDQQDPWLHGYYQRYPAYGGFGSFRPYNYRHVFSQTQIASGWGSAHGMPYSQQFWNKYRGSYLDKNLHADNRVQSPAELTETQPQILIPRSGTPVHRTSVMRPISYEYVPQQLSAPSAPALAQQVAADGRAVHVFPQR